MLALQRSSQIARFRRRMFDVQDDERSSNVDLVGPSASISVPIPQTGGESNNNNSTPATARDGDHRGCILGDTLLLIVWELRCFRMGMEQQPRQKRRWQSFLLSQLSLRDAVSRCVMSCGSSRLSGGVLRSVPLTCHDVCVVVL